MKNLIKGLAAASLTLSLVQTGAAADPGAVQPIRMPQLHAAASIVRDTNHIAHVQARNEHDLFFLQGWVHAEDRLFQMDYERRAASGTVAELLGAQALESDVTLRTLGLRRAAQQSVPALTADSRTALQAYADGVNAWVAAHALPPEYGALGLTRFAPWTPADSLVIGKLISFSLSFELDVDATVRYLSYVQSGAKLGFDGDKLYHEDLVRSAPFDPASTIPDASRQPASARPVPERPAPGADASWIHPKTRELAEAYLLRARRVPQLKAILDKSDLAGSNLWAVSGALSDTGHPLIANDDHLGLPTPSQFYPIGLEASSGLTVAGESFAGVPGVILGYNRKISWAATNLPIDVTDTYQEQVVPYAASPSGLATLYKGQPEPVIPIPATFRINQLGRGILDHIVVVPPGGS